MKRINYLPVFTSVLLTAFIGCIKDKTHLNTVKPVDAVTEYYEAINTYVAGRIDIYSYNTLASQPTSAHSTQFSGQYKKHSGQAVCLGAEIFNISGKAHIKYKEMDCKEVFDPAQDLEMWGQVIRFVADNNTFSSTYRHDFYIPSKVHISSPQFIEDQPISVGSTIMWNADKANPKEDMIEISYDPGSYENGEKPGDAIKKQFAAGHSGSYTISSGDLSTFPTGAYITVSVQRYNYEIFTNPDLKEDFLIRAGSVVRSGFFVTR